MPSRASHTVALAVTIAALAAPVSLSAQDLPDSDAPAADSAVFGLPLVDGLAVDGRLEEWDGVRVVYLIHGSEGVDGRSEPEPEDLSVEVRVAWNARGVFLAARWTDDQLDTEVLARDQADWTDSDGRVLDRMYLYDDLAFRLVWKDFSFGAWLAPRTDEPAQWAVVNYGRGTAGSYLEDVAVTDVVARDIAGGGIALEARFGWGDLKRPPPFFDDVELQLVATDADAPGVALSKKADDMAYLSWRSPVALMRGR